MIESMQFRITHISTIVDNLKATIFPLLQHIADVTALVDMIRAMHHARGILNYPHGAGAAIHTYLWHSFPQMLLDHGIDKSHFQGWPMCSGYGSWITTNTSAQFTSFIGEHPLRGGT